MEKKFKENWASEDELAAAVLSITEALNNFTTLELPTPLESEKEIIVELNDKYNLKVKFDAFYWDYILDHKTVSIFTKEEEADEKYWQQMKLYQYARYKQTWEKIPATLLKADLQALVPEEMKESTVNDMKDYLRTHPLKERCWNRIEFKRDDSIIEEMESLLKRAMKKADYLQTLTLDDVL